MPRYLYCCTASTALSFITTGERILTKIYYHLLGFGDVTVQKVRVTPVCEICHYRAMIGVFIAQKRHNDRIIGGLYDMIPYMLAVTCSGLQHK